jgi:tetratricopeptide (TPR) repeat protein
MTAFLPIFEQNFTMQLALFFVFAFSFSVCSQSDFQKGELAFAKKDYPKAIEWFSKHLDEHPDDPATLESIGDVYCAQNKWKSGLSYFEKLKTRFPKNADYHYKYGGALGMVAKNSNKFKALGMIGDVRESFEKALELNPKHIDARWALIELYLELPGIVGGSESKAKRYASELAKLSPVDGHLANGRIAEYYKRWSEAEKHYKNAIAVGGSKTCYQKLADLYKKSNQPEKARETMAEYSQKNKS